MTPPKRRRPAAAKTQSKPTAVQAAPEPQPEAEAEPAPPAPVAKSLTEKLEWIQSRVGHVDKTGKLAFGNTKYDYMQEHGLFAVLKPLWREAKVSFTGGLATGLDIPPVSQQGNQVTILWRGTLRDSESGDSISEVYVCHGVDSGDKAPTKAMTGAHKYALQKFFAVPTEKIDDYDTDPSEANPRQAANPAAGTINAKEADVLRTTVSDAVAQDKIKAQVVKAYLQSTYGVDLVNQLKPDDAISFSEWLTRQIAPPS